MAESISRLVAALPASVPFVGPETIERETGIRFKARLGANESAFGISPKAQEAMQAAAATVSYYGDPTSFDLRTELARRHDLNFENILVGSGIDGIFSAIAHAFVDPGSPVVTSKGSYPTFNYFMTGFGAKLIQVPYKSEAPDLDALAEEAARLGARLVFLANPDNPTGAFHGKAAIEGFLKRLPTSCIAVLDEAYADFAPPDSLLNMDGGAKNLIRLRTFSKAHGMAGLRIGYAVACPDTLDAMNKIRVQFGVNRLAQAAALASLKDAPFLDSVIAEVVKGRDEYVRLGEELGIRPLPSHTNFVAFDLESPERVTKTLATLQQKGVFARTGPPPNNRLLRVTIGDAPRREIFAKALREVLK